MTAVTAPRIAIADPAFRADPYETYRALRERAPVLRLSEPEAWAVTGYDEVRALLRDVGLRARAPAAAVREVRNGHPLVRARQDAGRLFASFMTYRTQPDHARLRRLVMPALSRSRTAARRARIEAFAEARIGEALERGQMEVIGDLSRPLTMAVISELVGIPEERQPAAARWAPDIVYRADPGATAAQRERGMMAMVGLSGQLRELLAGGSLRPDGLLAALDRAAGEGGLTPDEVVAHCAILLFVGHLTSQHLIANGILALLRRPDEWERLRACPELIEPAVEELLRFDSPAPVVTFTAGHGVDVGGETIRAGDAVLVLIGAAHRDPAVFADPDRLDIARDPNPHLGFGYGAYHCVGAELARLEAQVAIGTLVRRVPPPRLATEDLSWRDTFIIRGLKALPILLEG